MEQYRGILFSFDNVKLPDGTRSGKLKIAVPQNNLFRRLDRNIRFVYGTVQCTGDPQSPDADVEFIDSENQSLELDNASAQMLEILSLIPNMAELARDNSNGPDFYGALVHNTWEFRGTAFKLDHRSAGNVIAELRGWNERYLDFFGNGTEGEIQQEVGDLFNGIGLQQVGVRDLQSEADEMMEILETCEARPRPGDPPNWLGIFDREFNLNNEILNRMIYCALGGQAVLEEWERFYLLFALQDIDD